MLSGLPVSAFLSGVTSRSLSPLPCCLPREFSSFFVVPSSSVSHRKYVNASCCVCCLPSRIPNLRRCCSVGSAGVNALACCDAVDMRELPTELDPSRMPRHVAIIMDGNSRWAERQGWPSTVGHEAGVRALKEVVKLSQKWGIEVLTVFAFSTENWLRPKVLTHEVCKRFRAAASIS
jgi:hypothetical protein